MDPNIYAKTVVTRIVKMNPPQKIWCGNGAFTVWIIEMLGIHWVYTMVFSRMYGLDSMAKFLFKEPA